MQPGGPGWKHNLHSENRLTYEHDSIRANSLQTHKRFVSLKLESIDRNGCRWKLEKRKHGSEILRRNGRGMFSLFNTYACKAAYNNPNLCENILGFRKLLCLIGQF